MNIKHMIFDFDGTLADTLPVLFHACRSVFLAFDGRELSMEQIRPWFGPTELAIIERHLLNRDRAAEAVEAFLREYESAHDALVRRDPDIASLLRELRDAGAGLALFTGKSRRTLDISLSKLGWDVSFDCIVTGDDVAQPKPSPEGIERILRELNWDRRDAVFIGDSVDDQQAGRAAGVLTLAAGWMKMTQDPRDRLPADRYFERLPELRAYLRERLARQSQ